MNRSDRLIEFLGLRRSIVGLLILVVFVGLGERVGERYLPIYLMALGGGAMSVGLLQGLTNLLGALYSYPGGYLADHIGVKRSLLVFNVMAMAGYLVVVLVPSWPAVIAGSLLFLSWSAVSAPAMMNLVGNTLPSTKRTMGVSLHSVVRRIPMTLGPLLGGLFIDTWGQRDGVRLAFCAALAATLVGMVAQQRLIADTPGRVPPTPTAGRPLALLRQMTPALRGLLISDILIRFCEQIPYAFVVVWCLNTVAHPVSAFEFGVLTAVEMGTAVLVYVPVAHFADRSGKKPFVTATFVFFTSFPIVLMFCESFWPLVAAFVVRGLKEFGDPTRKALILDLSPPERRATMFGFYYLLRDTVVSLAALLGAVLWQVSPVANFWFASAFGALGTLWFVLHGADVDSPGKPGSADVDVPEGSDETVNR